MILTTVKIKFNDSTKPDKQEGNNYGYKPAKGRR